MARTRTSHSAAGRASGTRDQSLTRATRRSVWMSSTMHASSASSRVVSSSEPRVAASSIASASVTASTRPSPPAAGPRASRIRNARRLSATWAPWACFSLNAELGRVVRLEEQVAIGERVHADGNQVGQAERPSRRLRHLGAGEIEELVVHPVPHPAPAVAQIGLALGDLVDMVELAVVDAAGVDVEVVPEQRHAHHGALQVPPGCADPPGRLPLHHPLPAVGEGAPQREIGLVALALHRVDPGPLEHALEVEPGQLAVVGLEGGVEVQAERQRVAVAAFLEGAGELDHPGDVLGGLGPVVGRGHVERRQVVPVGLGVVAGDVLHRTPLEAGRLFDLVLALVGVLDQVPDVGDVDDVADVDAPPAQCPLERVGHHVRPHVAEVLVGVHGRPARVQPHVARLECDDPLHPAAERVADAQRRHGYQVGAITVGAVTGEGEACLVVGLDEQPGDTRLARLRGHRREHLAHGLVRCHRRARDAHEGGAGPDLARLHPARAVRRRHEVVDRQPARVDQPQAGRRAVERPDEGDGGHPVERIDRVPVRTPQFRTRSRTPPRPPRSRRRTG